MTSYVPVIVLTQYNVDSVATQTGKSVEELWAMLEDLKSQGRAAVVKIPRPEMITPEYKYAHNTEWVAYGVAPPVSDDAESPVVDTWDDN